MTRIYNETIAKIQDGTIVYITDDDNEKMMFICERKHGVWCLHSNDYGKYCPNTKTLEELQETIHKDWQSGLIVDIMVFDSEENKN